MQIWVSWRKRNLFDLEWLAEEKRKGEDLERERLRHVDEHMQRMSGYQQMMQGTTPQPITSTNVFMLNLHRSDSIFAGLLWIRYRNLVLRFWSRDSLRTGGAFLVLDWL